MRIRTRLYQVVHALQQRISPMCCLGPEAPFLSPAYTSYGSSAYSSYGQRRYRGDGGAAASGAEGGVQGSAVAASVRIAPTARSCLDASPPRGPW